MTDALDTLLHLHRCQQVSDLAELVCGLATGEHYAELVQKLQSLTPGRDRLCRPPTAKQTLSGVLGSGGGLTTALFHAYSHMPQIVQSAAAQQQ